jgi:hypothetical protein
MRNLFLSIITAATVCLIAGSANYTGAQSAPAQGTAAQSHEPPAVLEIVRESIKEGHAPAHEKVESDWANAFRKHNFPYHQLALTSMAGPSEAWFLIGFPSFAAVQGASQEMEKSGFKSEMDTLETRDGELRSNSRTMYAVYRKDMSYKPELLNVGKTRYIGILSFRLKLGHMKDFEEGGKKFLAADEKAGLKTPSIAYEVVTGAPADLFLFFEPMESLKDLDEAPAREKAVAAAMGEDYQQLMKGAGDVFNSIEYTLFAVNPRMSYASKETEDADPAFWRPDMTASR